MKIGIGYDVHKLVKNRKLIIGGVEIPHEKGLEGHSDADVLIHSIIDSILGAIGEGDIGKHFPDDDDQYKNISSIKLLSITYELMNHKNYKVGNIDSVIIAQNPKIQPYIFEMKKIISMTLKTNLQNVNIKATTTEKLGFVGREEGIACQSVCIITNSL